MGLSASQARLLNLTARMHDIEYKAQNLEAQKLQMANESRQVYQEYDDALSKTKVQVRKMNTDGSVTYEDATSQKLKDAGYAFQAACGDNIVYPTMGEAVKALMDAELVEQGSADANTTYNADAVTNFINSGLIILVKVANSEGKAVELTSAKEIKKLIEAPETSGTYEVNVATDTNLQEASNEIDLKKAEAKYEADMRRINQKDTKFDTDLAAMEAERNAIKTEMETLKSIAKENVDRTYKLFS